MFNLKKRAWDFYRFAPMFRYSNVHAKPYMEDKPGNILYFKRYCNTLLCNIKYTWFWFVNMFRIKPFGHTTKIIYISPKKRYAVNITKCVHQLPSTDKLAVAYKEHFGKEATLADIAQMKIDKNNVNVLYKGKTIIMECEHVLPPREELSKAFYVQYHREPSEDDFQSMKVDMINENVILLK